MARELFTDQQWQQLLEAPSQIARAVAAAAGSDRQSNVPVMLRGTYQSPILVQWQPAEKQERRIDIVVVQFS